jgi:hypothetical protein
MLLQSRGFKVSMSWDDELLCSDFFRAKESPAEASDCKNLETLKL